ncbi:MAG TPA: tyrosine-type recombinase/integrase [Solirubrobacteraceae bacterium]|nr:tyrosine-type recombinase/integrase [Solirubrobacteraceae bacterium]
MVAEALTSSLNGSCRTQRVVLPDGERTWTVLDGDHRVVSAAEEYLEYLRMLGRSPNTVKSYARALALWWQFLDAYELAWDAVRIEDFGRFLGWLRSGDSPALASIERRPARFSEGTVALRVQAVCSLYRYHHFNGVETASRLYEREFSHGRAYKPMLEHLARRRGYERSVVRVSRPRPATPPTLTPEQVGLILDACARWDPAARDWQGSVRDRLLWALLAETGMRLGEALALQHRDWHTGLGDTPFVEVVPRDDHPHGLRVKNGGFRRIYISDQLDRLYGEYLWRLCDQGADGAVGDLDCWWVFVNLAREPRFQPMRAETVAWQVRRLRRALEGRVPAGFTPHWFRHTHATALLLSGIAEHVVSRRLGHLDIQTTQNLYGWVSEDAEQRTVAQWQELTAGWRTDEDR